MARLRLRSDGTYLWSEKLPFAGYSVVKDHPGEISPRGTYGMRGAFPRTPLARSLAGPRSPAPLTRLAHPAGPPCLPSPLTCAGTFDSIVLAATVQAETTKFFWLPRTAAFNPLLAGASDASVAPNHPMVQVSGEARIAANHPIALVSGEARIAASHPAVRVSGEAGPEGPSRAAKAGGLCNQTKWRIPGSNR